MSSKMSNRSASSCRSFVAGALITLILMQAVEVDLATQLRQIHSSMVCQNKVESEGYRAKNVSTLQIGSISDELAFQPPRKELDLGSKAAYINTSLSNCPPNTKKNRGFLKSQSGEDARLMEYFGNQCNGRYVEMGALDGIRYSNTYAFDKIFGWSGLLVELVPQSYEKLKKNRQANAMNTIVNAAVCDKRRTIHYFDSTDLARKKFGATSGIVEFTSKTFQRQWWPQLKPDMSNTVEIECLPFQDIVEEQFGDKPMHFDFFSLDVEGSEVEVLQSIDFSKISFGILFAEANPKSMDRNPMIKTIMQENGYIFMEEWHYSYWFKHPEFDRIYEGIV